MVDAFSASPLVHAVGVTLIAFLWQGSAIGAAAFAILALLRRATPQTRYVIACAALGVMSAAPLLTLGREIERSAASVTIRASETSTHPAPATVIAPVDGALAITPSAQVDERSAALFPVVVAVWSAGVLALTVHLLFGWIGLGRLRRDATPVDDDAWAARLTRMADRLSVVRRVRLLESARVDVPAVIGWLRPAILLPASALTGLTTSQLDAILAHELAHVRRADFLVNLVQRAIETALFYHPAVWWLSAEIRRAREHCCDDIAAACCDSRREYAAALGALAALRAGAPNLAVGATGGDLVGRIRRLVDTGAARSRVWSGGHVMIVVPAVLFVLASVSASASQDASLALPAIVAPPASSAGPAPLPIPVPAVTVVKPREAPRATGSVFGQVRDSQGGVMPGVTVTVHSAQAGIDRSATSNARGEFRIDNLPDGAYTVNGSIPGFMTVSVNVTVASDEITVPFRLSVGAITEHVSVTRVRGAAPPAATLAPMSSETLSTSGDYHAAAEAAYARGDFDDADALLTRALDLLRTERPALFQVQIPSGPIVLSTGPAGRTIGPIRVGGDIRPPQKVHNVSPLYPPDAIAAGISGTVTVQGIVAKDGTVIDAHIVSGLAQLNTSALDAVRLWRFTPTLLNGVPVEVGATVTIAYEIR